MTWKSSNKKMLKTIKCKTNKTFKIKSILKSNRKISWCIWKMMILKMMTLTMIYHPFPDQCLSPETSTKPKGKKEIAKDSNNFLIEDPEKIRNLMKLLKSSEDSKNNENANNTSKSRYKHNKMPLLTRFSMKLDVNWNFENKSKTKTRRRKSKRE